MNPEPADDDLHATFHVSNFETPYDRMPPSLRSAADDAVRADRARWTLIAGHWQLQWNGREGTP